MSSGALSEEFKPEIYLIKIVLPFIKFSTAYEKERGI